MTAQGMMRSRRSRNLFLAGLAAAIFPVLSAGTADAGECRCYFSQALIPNIRTAVKIESTRNKVEATTPEGWQAAQPGQTLAIGDSVRTGEDSSAVVRIGTGCVVKLSPRSTLFVRPADQNYCAAVDRPPLKPEEDVHASAGSSRSFAAF